MDPKNHQKDCVEHEEKNSDQSKSSSLSPYRLMLHGVSEQLNSLDCKNIAMIIGLKRAQEDKIQDSIDLLRMMENRNEVSEDDISLLRFILKKIDNKAALECISQYENNIFGKNSNLWSAIETSNIHPQAQEATMNATSASVVVTQERRYYRHMQKENDSLPFSSSLMYEKITHVLSKYGISNDLRKKLKMSDYMTLHKMHLKGTSGSPQEIVSEFLTRLMSYDYRSVLLLKDVESIEESQEINEPTKNTKSQITGKATKDLKLSCRDMIFVILNCCDSFLMQEVLSKLAFCQLAVPVLLPTLDHSKVVMLLWGLLRITKVCTDPDSNKTHEKVVVKHPFPTVSVLRLGNINISKSNILNKMLGPVQNNDDHPYFLSYEQGGPTSVLSQGTVEGIWYLPKTVKMSQRYFRKATCFLHVRGDAEEFDKQRNFVAKFSTILIVFITICNIPSKTRILKELATSSRVILVVYGRADTSTDHILEDMGKQVTILKASKPNPLEIGEQLCTEINVIHTERGHGSVYSIEHSLPVCSKSNIDVDIQEPLCEGAKKAVQNSMTWRMEETLEFKQKIFPLQFEWSYWSRGDKHQMWDIVKENRQGYYVCIRTEEQLRNEQRVRGLSSEVRNFLQEFFHPDEKYTQFVVLWLQHFFKEHSVASITPLRDTLQDDSQSFREITEKIIQIRKKLDNHTAISEDERKNKEGELKELSDKQSTIQHNLKQTSEKFDACYLGFEHFIREFAQMYECFHDFLNPHEMFKTTFVDVMPMPQKAAELLLNGHPLEILDGDAWNVPKTWVRGVLSAVTDMTSDARIYVISTIGMQSSGKSTLLNSIFGTRFNVNAGRCTRGMFLQLIPVDDELKKDFGFDFVAVIDTEGFKAHATVGAHVDENLVRRDNKLATFALCLSDTTLINIDVQNDGEDLLSILQISAHAFIRMRKISLPSSCYFIQQFLSDVTTSRRDPISTRNILQTLDQAFEVASTEEGNEDHYRKFSDCFKIVCQDSVDNVPYIPDLWGTSKSVPSCEYSETVLKLKSALLREGTMQNDKTQMISKFVNKIEDVWKAVEQEDFVFKFRNTAEVVLCNDLSFPYKNAQLNLLQEMIKWELQKKQKISTMTEENISIYTLVQEGDKKLYSHGQIWEEIEDELQKEEYKNVWPYTWKLMSERFLCQRQVKDSIKRVMERELKILTNIKTKNKQLLPKIKEKLQQTATTLTDQLKDRLSDAKLNFQKTELEEDTEISNAFQLEWRKQMKIVQANYPIDSDDEIKQGIQSSMKACLIQCSENTGLSMEIKYILSNYNIDELCSSSPDVSTVDDLQEAATSIKTCSEEVSRHLHHLCEMLKEELSRKTFVFSSRFLQSLTNNLSLLVKVQCKGCKKRELLVCLACNILHQAYKTRPNNSLATMRNMFLQELKNILPSEVIEILGRMEEDDIEKHSFIPLAHRRHVLDAKFLSLVQKLSTSNYDTILSIIADSEELILEMLVQFRVYEEISMKFILLTAMLKLSENKDITKAAQALTLAFICSWGLPICQSLQVTFVKEHSMQFLLEQEREGLYLKFKDLCRDAY